MNLVAQRDLAPATRAQLSSQRMDLLLRSPDGKQCLLKAQYTDIDRDQRQFDDA